MSEGGGRFLENGVRVDDPEADTTFRFSSPCAALFLQLSGRHIERHVLPSAQLSGLLRVLPARPPQVRLVPQQHARPPPQPPRPTQLAWLARVPVPVARLRAAPRVQLATQRWLRAVDASP